VTTTRHYNLYLNASKDAALVAWLDAQSNTSEAIREGLRGHLQAQQSPASAPGAIEVAIDARPALPKVSNRAIREVIAGALDDRHLNLRAIRQVVEAVIKDALAEMTIAGATAGETPDEDDWLDGLDEMIID